VKRKLIILLLVSSLLGYLLPVQSMAEEHAAEEAMRAEITAETNRNWYTKSDHTYDDEILDALMNGVPVMSMFGETRQDLVDLSDAKYGLTTDNYISIRYYLEYSHPELVGYVTLFPQYHYGSAVAPDFYAWFTENCVEERAAFKIRAPEVMAEVNALIPEGADTFQKVHIVHDYLISNTAYDFDNYEAGERVLGYNFDAYGVFVRHLSMCEGYSLAFKYIMTQMGIPCAVVISNTAAHAWNIVQIDGEWYHVDLSADDGIGYDMLGHVSHKYLCISTETLLEMRDIRSDFKIYFDSAEPVFTDATCATSKKYESGQAWNGCESCCHYVKNQKGGIDLYTIDGESHYLMKNGDYYYLPNENTTWHPNGISSSYYTRHHGRLAGEGAILYMTTPRSIYRIDTVTGEKTAVYQVSRSKGAAGQIFGLAFVEHELYCTVGTDEPTTNETWLRVADYVPEKSGIFGLYDQDAWIIDSDRVLSFSGSGLPYDLVWNRVFAASYDENGRMIDCKYVSAVTDTMPISREAAICRLFMATIYLDAYYPVKTMTVIDMNE